MIRYGIMYKQGDILLIPIPFTNLVSNKKRPVLVLSNDMYNSTKEDMVVVAITSNLREKDYTILISNNDLIEGTLKIDSHIRADKIYSLSQKIAIKKFGRVKDEIITKVNMEIGKLISLAEAPHF